MNRRRFIVAASAGAFALLRVRDARAAMRPDTETHDVRFDAIAFDGLVIFDVRPVAATAEALFPGRGAALMTAWRARQFEYQWLRALGGRYADFLRTSEDALEFAAAQLDLALDAPAKTRLLNGFVEPQLWSDVAPSLMTLRQAGFRLAMLSNMTAAMMNEGLSRGGVAPLFDAILTTDSIATYKPDPRAYRLGVDALGVPKERILFVAFAGWDAAGAKWFGYPTFWVDRLDAPAERLDSDADGVGSDLAALIRFTESRSRAE